ncbi:MAG: hypothetical protein NPIRA01_38340 [Nitrospirales bacterium]|nr:MAG: hypothetical protein NPIRA01_38340 [Nitrospirales bacterium]
MNSRSFSAGRFALFTDGEALGFVKSVSGGNTKGEVATKRMGSNKVIKKHLAGIKHEEITVECGMGMGRPVYDWIQSSFNLSSKTKARSSRARSGMIIHADFDYKERRAIIFSDAHITELTIPALDGSLKDPAYLTVTLNPTRLRHEKRQGERLSHTKDTKKKKWLASGFTFEMGDLPCERVTKIDAFTLKQSVVKVGGVNTREPTKHPSHLEVPNFKVTFSARDAAPWEDWFNSFVIQGNCADDDELNGQITLLGPNHKDELARITLRHVGIISLQPAKYHAKKGTVTKMVAELYVEEMKFAFNQADT